MLCNEEYNWISYARENLRRYLLKNPTLVFFLRSKTTHGREAEADEKVTFLSLWGCIYRLPRTNRPNIAVPREKQCGPLRCRQDTWTRCYNSALRCPCASPRLSNPVLSCGNYKLPLGRAYPSRTLFFFCPTAGCYAVSRNPWAEFLDNIIVVDERMNLAENANGKSRPFDRSRYFV